MATDPRQTEIKTPQQPITTIDLTPGEKAVIRRALDREMDSQKRALVKEQNTPIGDARAKMIQDLALLQARFN